jgi:hypothetical protein
MIAVAERRWARRLRAFAHPALAARRGADIDRLISEGGPRKPAGGGPWHQPADHPRARLIGCLSRVDEAGCRGGARIHDRITGDRDRVFARDVATGVAVMHIPDVTVEVLLQDHDMAGPNRRHSRSRNGTGKPAPNGREVQLRNDAAKPIQRCLASAERVRTSRRATVEDLVVTGGRGHGP